MSEVKEFYDEFTVRQIRASINHRHLYIQRWLEGFGLKKNHRVLEIGCGIGTQTELMLRFLSSNGYIEALDISPKSIEIAKERLKKYDNVKLLAMDFKEFESNNTFDVIVLPDVLEHIPMKDHKDTFRKLNLFLKDDGFVLIHIPDPYHLEWCHTHKKEDLQIIDQPIHLDHLYENCGQNGFYVNYLKSYSIYYDRPDYRVIVLKKRDLEKGYSGINDPVGDSFIRRAKKKITYLLRGNK